MLCDYKWIQDELSSGKAPQEVVGLSQLKVHPPGFKASEKWATACKKPRSSVPAIGKSVEDTVSVKHRPHIYCSSLPSSSRCMLHFPSNACVFVARASFRNVVVI